MCFICLTWNSIWRRILGRRDLCFRHIKREIFEEHERFAFSHAVNRKLTTSGISAGNSLKLSKFNPFVCAQNHSRRCQGPSTTIFKAPCYLSRSCQSFQTNFCLFFVACLPKHLSKLKSNRDRNLIRYFFVKSEMIQTLPTIRLPHQHNNFFFLQKII